MDLTQFASTAIVAGLRNAGAGAAVPHIVCQLHDAAVAANGAMGREEAVALMVLANAIETDAGLAGVG